MYSEYLICCLEGVKQIDFWITAGDSPAEILSKYMTATGKPPVMPEYGLGFWQSKLRYQTQDELMTVAREYHRRGIPLDVIVADFFHWTVEGAWAFAPVCWPDPETMVKELKEMGTRLMVSVWPTVSTFFDGLKAEGENSVNLVRCAWAGSQKYGALVSSGDIPFTFESLKFQIVCGMQMAMAGIPWWTTDIGGFHGGNVEEPEFRELLIRWFQFGTFCPVMRLHGHRMPGKPGISTSGGGRMGSGADNEIWSSGQENYEIMKHHIEIRERLRPYLRDLMRKSSETGEAVMRPLCYDFPEDTDVWDIQDQFMLGAALLVAPMIDYGRRSREVYLPAGTDWLSAIDGKQHCGGQWIVEEAHIEKIPVFVRGDRGELVGCFR